MARLFGAPEESRTPKIWFLRPTRIPDSVTGAINISMKIEFKSAEKELWLVAQKYPYTEKKFSTTERDFTPTFPPRQDVPLEKIVIKQLGAPRKNRTFI